jgi:ribosomal protein S18 acetylase RimI-like enzyme
MSESSTHRGVYVTRVSFDDEIVAIKALQTANQRKNLDLAEAEAEGFVTAIYTLDFLRAMNDACPSIIAKDGDLVVGYALVAQKSDLTKGHELLKGLIDAIDAVQYDGKPLSESNYVLVGQLCVAKGYRGMGLAGKMYAAFRAALHDQYAYLITDVASDNPRSVRAHLKVGFKVVDRVSHDGVEFQIIVWDWNA